MDYKFNKQAGALNEIAPAPAKRRAVAASFSNVGPPQQQTHSLLPTDSYASAHDSGLFNLADLTAGAPPVHAQSSGHGARPVALPPRTNGLDPQSQRRDHGMFFYTVREGERVRVIHKNGRVDQVKGPRRIWRWGKTIDPMMRHVAHPGEFLIVRFRDGRQEHHEGPANVWFDPRDHLAIQKEDALQISAKEAVVVYSRNSENGEVTRRFVHGPASFVPAPGEWIHTFSWHGSRGGEDGYTKVPNALVFQKLWFLPDQMYHDVQDVRTADDAVLTVRLMIFFELIDLPRMLDTSHDPIGDFVNAATSDVVEFTGKHDFESFKRHTEQLNDLASYRQLVGRAEQCGYRINKVVYRGYGAPENLQRMHDEAIESRTRLQLERATQQQAQDLEDFKQERELVRAGRLRTEREASTAHNIAQAERQHDAELRAQKARAEFTREQARLTAEQQAAIAQKQDEQRLSWLSSLQRMSVDLTAYLTQARADRVIEVRGGQEDMHLHLDSEQGAHKPAPAKPSRPT